MSVGDCSNTNLFGNSQKKGELDVLLCLLDLKEHLLDELIPSFGFPPIVVKAVGVGWGWVEGWDGAGWVVTWAGGLVRVASGWIGRGNGQDWGGYGRGLRWDWAR